jgi:hypothetical protein
MLEIEISYWVIRKRIVAIMYRGTVPSVASTRVDAIEDGGCRYVAERDGQVRAFLHPDVRGGSKLPNRVGHSSVDPEPAQNIELAIEHGEAAGQSYSVGVTRPGRSNGFDCIGNRIIAEYPVSSCSLSPSRRARRKPCRSPDCRDRWPT